jgi:hypothetical protein
VNGHGGAQPCFSAEQGHFPDQIPAAAQGGEGVLFPVKALNHRHLAGNENVESVARFVLAKKR